MKYKYLLLNNINIIDVTSPRASSEFLTLVRFDAIEIINIYYI